MKYEVSIATVRVTLTNMVKIDRIDLIGTLPEEICSLERLEGLYLHDNYIGGEFIANCSHFHHSLNFAYHLFILCR